MAHSMCHCSGIDSIEQRKQCNMLGYMCKNQWVGGNGSFILRRTKLWIHSIMIKGDIRCNILTALQIKLTCNNVYLHWYNTISVLAIIFQA